MINLSELKEIADDLALIAGVPCYLVPMPLNVPATHLKLEFLGKSLNRLNQVDKLNNGSFKANLILRSDGFNEKLLDEVMPADEKLSDELSNELTFETANHICIINTADTQNEDIGFQFPEQMLGISEPDPSSNDISSRMINTRVFQLKINYSKK